MIILLKNNAIHTFALMKVLAQEPNNLKQFCNSKTRGSLCNHQQTQEFVLIYLIPIEISNINMDNLKSLQQALSVDVRLEELMIMTADLLMDLVEQEGAPCQTIFNSSAVPNISLPDFIRRLHKFTQFSPECLIIAIIYVDRYNLVLPEFTLSSLNVHKMVLTALLLATKFQDDFYYDNKAFQFAGGVNVTHLHQLEIQMFQKLEFNLYVGEEQFQQLQLKLYQVYGDDDQN